MAAAAADGAVRWTIGDHELPGPEPNWLQLSWTVLESNLCEDGRKERRGWFRQINNMSSEELLANLVSAQFSLVYQLKDLLVEHVWSLADLPYSCGHLIYCHNTTRFIIISLLMYWHTYSFCHGFLWACQLTHVDRVSIIKYEFQPNLAPQYKNRFLFTHSPIYFNLTLQKEITLQAITNCVFF